MSGRSVRVAVLGALGLLTLLGCGSTTLEPSAEPSVDITVLPGDRVGDLAQQQLEAEHPDMATGEVTCPDLRWEVDAAVRCEKVAELSEGRRVTVLGTVMVTSTAGYGTLRVELDDEVAGYGVDGDYLSRQVSAWVAAREARAGAVRCPSLPGRPDAFVRCPVRIDGRPAQVRVSVTGLDEASYRTSYAMRWDPAPG